jgi:hypothetical protein
MLAIGCGYPDGNDFDWSLDGRSNGRDVTGKRGLWSASSRSSEVENGGDAGAVSRVAGCRFRAQSGDEPISPGCGDRPPYVIGLRPRRGDAVRIRTTPCCESRRSSRHGEINDYSWSLQVALLGALLFGSICGREAPMLANVT